MFISITYIIAAAYVGWTPTVWTLVATGLSDYLLFKQVVEYRHGPTPDLTDADDISTDADATTDPAKTND